MTGTGAVGAQAHHKALPKYFDGSDELIIDIIRDMPHEWMMQLFYMLLQLREMNRYGDDYRAELTKASQTFAYYFTLRMVSSNSDYKLLDVQWPDTPPQ